MTLSRYLWGALCLLLLSACSTPDLLTPPDAPRSSYTGVWLGKASDNVGGGEIELALIQTGDSLSGEARLTFTAGLLRQSATGVVTGRIEGTSIRARVTPDNPDYCPYEAVLERSGDSLEGSYRGVGCRGTIEGDLTLQKQ